MKRGEEKGEREKGRERKPPIRVARLHIRRTTRIIRVALAKGEAEEGRKGGRKRGAGEAGGRGEKVWRGEDLMGGRVEKVWWEGEWRRWEARESEACVRLKRATSGAGLSLIPAPPGGQRREQKKESGTQKWDGS